jgi:hypothetical protein
VGGPPPRPPPRPPGPPGGRGGADAAAAARHDGHLALQRLLRRLAELGLLERPIFDLERLVIADALEAADALGIGDHLDRGLGQVGGDARVLGTGAEREQADARHQDDARRRVELLLLDRGFGVVAREIGVVVGPVGLEGGARGFGEAGEVARVGGRQDERLGLGADGMVGRHDAGLGIAPELRAGHVVEHLPSGAVRHDEALVGAVLRPHGERREPAQEGRDRRRDGDIVRRRRGGKNAVGAARDARLGASHQRDHALIGLARARPEAENAVLLEHQPLDLGIGLEHLRRLLGEGEAGHDVGHARHPPAKHLGADGLAVGLVGEREHGVGVGMVDELYAAGRRGAGSRPRGWARRCRAGCSAGH